MTQKVSLDPRLTRSLEAFRTHPLAFDVSLLRQLSEAGSSLSHRGCFSEAQACFRVAGEIARQEDQRSLLISTILGLARTFIEKAPASALAILSQLDVNQLSPDQAATFLTMTGNSFKFIGEYAIAQSAYDSALLHATHHNLTAMAYVVQANQALYFFDCGKEEKALATQAEALEGLLELKREGDAGLVLCNMAQHDILLSRYDEASDKLTKARDLLHSSNNVKLAAFLDLNAGELALLDGELDAAASHFNSARLHADAVPLPAIQLQSIAWKAVLEQEMSQEALTESLAGSTRDFLANGFRLEAANLAALALAMIGRDPTPTMSIRYLDSVQSYHPRSDLLRSHYSRLVQCTRVPSPIKDDDPLPLFLTHSRALQSTKATLARLVRTDVKILIEGESGTGKTFLARQLHRALSPKAPFIVVDCTNLEEHLFESKLFGHQRGSFTGAIADRVGLVEQANHGILFLDEIGEVSTEIQAKLLYTIEEQRYMPVGSRSEKRAEFRVMAATNRNVDLMLDQGTIRKDLFFRLAGFRVLLPPLRERAEDILPLAEAKLNDLNSRYGRAKRFRSDIWEALVRHNWPGNVRELNSTIERGYHLSTGRRISADDLSLGTDNLVDFSWDTARRDHLYKVLLLCRGNVSRAAHILGLNRTTLIYKMKMLKLRREDFLRGHEDTSDDTRREP